jgi:hypothetical protein
MRAAVRVVLKIVLLERLRSWLKWFETKASKDANFRRVCMRRNRNFAR